MKKFPQLGGRRDGDGGGEGRVSQKSLNVCLRCKTQASLKVLQKRINDEISEHSVVAFYLIRLFFKSQK